jgi:hypothetical protein
MDGTRTRRTRDRARQAWYARHRQRRFAASVQPRRVPSRCYGTHSRRSLTERERPEATGDGARKDQASFATLVF